MEREKYQTVLLIDDDIIVNHVQEKIVYMYNFAEGIIVKDSSKSALTYLNQLLSEKSNLPNVIFLDINMPLMNGFDFLDAFDLLIKEYDYNWLKENCKIVILTSSVDAEDIKRASANPYVYGYLKKPLTKEGLKSVQILQAV